jgi:hypothetical protein
MVSTVYTIKHTRQKFITAHQDGVHREFQLPQPPEQLEQLRLRLQEKITQQT